MSCSYNLTTVDPVNVWLQTLCWTCSLKPCLLGHHAVCACCVTAALPCVVVTQATDEISELASAVWLNAQSQEDKDSISESKAAVVFHTPTYTCRKVDSCFPEIEKWKALHNQTFDFMQIDHLWLNLFDFDLTWFHCVCVFFNHIHHVQFCHLWREGYLFLCAAVCFPLQLHRMWSVSNSPAVCRAGHFTCTVCDSGPLNSARTWGYLVFSKGACNG